MRPMLKRERTQLCHTIAPYPLGFAQGGPNPSPRLLRSNSQPFAVLADTRQARHLRASAQEPIPRNSQQGTALTGSDAPCPISLQKCRVTILQVNPNADTDSPTTKRPQFTSKKHSPPSTLRVLPVRTPTAGRHHE